VARFCALAGALQGVALNHLMEYLECNPSFKITYQLSMKISNLLLGYADSDWGNRDSSSRRSTSGMLMLYNKSPISWKSKMQKTTALSTAEPEYYSASTAAMEVLYLRFLLELGLYIEATRTTPRASSGGTTSSLDESGPNPPTWTSGSTSRIKSSRTARCGVSRFPPRPNWRTC
jgi:hypothetical protein